MITQGDAFSSGEWKHSVMISESAFCQELINVLPNDATFLTLSLEKRTWGPSTIRRKALPFLSSHFSRPSWLLEEGWLPIIIRIKTQILCKSSIPQPPLSPWPVALLGYLHSWKCRVVSLCKLLWWSSCCLGEKNTCLSYHQSFLFLSP